MQFDAEIHSDHLAGTVEDDISENGAITFDIQDEYGCVQPSGSVPVSNGRFSITVSLEASRRGADRDGRRYVMLVTATDVAGNRATATTTVVVPHDRR